MVGEQSIPYVRETVAVSDLLKESSVHIEKIRNSGAEALIGYPSGLLELVRLCRENNVKLSFKHIFSYAENLSEAGRRSIERAFSGEVWNCYGTAEFGLVAQECGRHDGLHINEESVRIDIVRIPDKTRGSVIITSLANEVMPLIRYAVGDTGHEVDEPCECGLRTKKIRLTGREGKIFTVKGKSIHYSDISTVLKMFDEYIEHYRIYEMTDELVIELLAADPQGEIEKRIIEKLRQDVSAHIRFRLRRVASLPRTPAGKAAVY